MFDVKGFLGGGSVFRPGRAPVGYGVHLQQRSDLGGLIDQPPILEQYRQVVRRPYRAHLFPSAQLPIVPFQPRCSLEPLWPGCQMPQSFPQRLATPVPCLTSGQGHPPPAAPNAGPPPHSPLPAVAAPRPSPPRQCSAGTPAASETGITGAAPDGHRPCPSPPQWPGPRR